MHQCRNEATAVLVSAVPRGLPNMSVRVIFKCCHVVLNMHAWRNGYGVKPRVKVFGYSHQNYFI